MDQLPLHPLPSFCLHVFKKLVLVPYYRFNNIQRGHWTKYTCFISIFNSGSVMSASVYCSLTHYTDTWILTWVVCLSGIFRKGLASQVFFQRCVLCWWYLVNALPDKHLCLLRSFLIYLVYSYPPISNLRWHFFSLLMFKVCEISSDKQGFLCQRPNSILKPLIPSRLMWRTHGSVQHHFLLFLSSNSLFWLLHLSPLILLHPFFKSGSRTLSNIFTTQLGDMM